MEHLGSMRGKADRVCGLRFIPFIPVGDELHAGLRVGLGYVAESDPARNARVVLPPEAFKGLLHCVAPGLQEGRSIAQAARSVDYGH